MAGSIDQLQIEIQATASDANKSINDLVKNLGNLQKSISRLDTSKFKKLSVNTSNLSANTQKISTSFNTLSNSVEKSTKRVNSLASAFGSLYANFFWVIRGMKSLWRSIGSTADYIEAYNYFDVSLEKIGSDWSHQFEQYGYDNAQAYAESFSQRLQQDLSGLSGLAISSDASENGLLVSTGLKNLGLNIQEITQYASQLASVTNSVGQVGEVSLSTSNVFTKLGADMSSLFNQDYNSVMKNLQSGLIGQSRALYKYGIDITNATLQTYAYDLCLSKAVSEMTQAEKMQLRLIAILDQSKVSWGDLANTINSPSNMLRQFTNNIKETGMVLGQLFVPLLQKVMPVINGITIAIKNLLTGIAGFFGIKLDLSSFGQGFSGMEDDIDGVTDSLDDATASAKKFKGQLQGFDKLNVITTQSDSGTSSGGAGGGIDLTDEILKATEEYKKVWDEAFERMENKAEVFAKKVEKALEPVKQLFKDISIGDWFAVGQDVSNIVVGINEFLTKALANVDWQSVGNSIGLFLAGLNWTEIFSSIGRLFWEAITSAIDLYKGIFDVAPIETGILSGVALLKWTGLGVAVSKAVAKMIAANMGVEIAKDAGIITALKTGLLANFTTALSTLGTNIGLLFENLFAGMVFKDAFVMAFGKIGVEIAGIGTIISGVLLSILNFVKMLQEGLNWLNEALMVVGIGLTAVGAIILGAPVVVAAKIAAIVASVATLVIVVRDNWDAIVEWTSNLFDKVSTFFSDLWEKVKGIWSVVSTWFSENVIEPIVSFFVGFATRVGQVFEGLWIIVQAVWEIASTWFNENVVQPIISFFAPIVEDISSFFSDLWEDIKNVWDVVSNWFSENIIEPVSSAFETACDKIGEFFTSLWSGIESGVVSAMNAVIGGIESAINFIVSGINSIISGFNDIVSWAAKVAEVDWGGVDLVPKVTLSRVSTYATGGFPEDGWFRASKGEYFGSFDDGTSVIANNNQIISGISNGVKSANAEQNALLREQNALLRQILAKDIGISTRDVFEAVRSENRDYINRNGESAFAF